MNRMHLYSLAAAVIAVSSSPSLAHHAFVTEFLPDQEGEVEGTVTEVIWANPHIRYGVDVQQDDGTSEVWFLQPPGNLPTYQREQWYEDTVQVGDRVRATGNLGRDGMKRLYATCIYLESGRRLGRCVVSGSVQEIIADPNVDYTVQPNDYEVDISGYWMNRYNFRATVDDLEPKPVPFTPESRAIYESREFGDDHVLRCLAPGLPRIFGSPYSMEVLDGGTHYFMLFLQNNSPRWVWMDGRSAPDNHPLTSMGYSVGRWEERTLVIETTHLEPGWLDGSGYPMSGGDGTRIVERWTVAGDGLTIDRIMTIHDDLYTEPLVRTRGSQRADASDGLVESPVCDPNSHYRDLYERDLLEDTLYDR